MKEEILSTLFWQIYKHFTDKTNQLHVNLGSGFEADRKYRPENQFKNKVLWS